MLPRSALILLFLLVPFALGQLSDADQRYFAEFTKVKRSVNSVKEKHLLKFLPMAGVSTQAAREITDYVVRTRPVTDLAALLSVPGVTEKDYSILTNYLTADVAVQDADLTVDDIIEQAAGGEEESADSTFRDDLAALAARPVELNTASPEELGRLPWLTPFNIYNILEYRKLRPFAKPADLLKVKGIDEEMFRQLSPFVTTSPPRLLEITRKVEEARRAMRARPVEGRFTSRVITSFPYSKEQFSSYGYPSTVGQKETLELSALGRVSAGAVWERDKGEKDLYDLQKYYIQAQGFKFLRLLIAGNYRLRFGQGLTVSDSGATRGGTSSSIMNRSSVLVKPDISSSENANYFGSAGILSFGGLDLVGFYSSRRSDATVEDRATLGDGKDDTPDDGSDNVISSFDPQADGLHTTPTEIGRRDAALKTTWGGRLQYGFQTRDGALRHLLVGLSGYQASWNFPLDPPMTDDNFFSFRGRLIRQAGFDWNVGLAGISFFGEFSASFQPEVRNFVPASNSVKNYGLGLLTGLVFSARNWKTELLFRRYSRDFFGFEKSVLSEYSSPNGETGFYLGQTLKVDKTLKFTGYADLFRKEWRTYDEVLPPFGWEGFVSAEKTFPDKFSLYSQLKAESKEMRLTVNGVGRNAWVDNDWRWRLEAKWEPRRTLACKARFETAGTRIRDLDKAMHSSLFFGDAAWTVSPALKIWVRNVVFDCDYNAGIWEYENDVPAYMSSGSFTGQGNRFYAYARSTIVPGKLFLHLKAGVTWYYKADSITVVLSETETPTQSELDAAQSILGDTRYDIHCVLEYDF